MSLYQETTWLRNSHWTVIRSRRLRTWFACAPSRTDVESLDRPFDTHAEAIAYADKEARK